ncbi:Serine/threonine protein kinase [Marininema mesophilum]|uniref:Serine/threonine-protein kinase PrkC n=1 Tax=Marininema mesophilum TaxID=1048340 RepID=A0A1H2Z4R3_9BACL|nr:protein kinase [Marininema mesophilum]SDX11789.1 Serine/threonine protein kinase [Marininema mesophilum]
MEGKSLGGRYEILRRLGGGGMAVVYLARDQLLERQVAIKVMNESLSHDEDFIRRFAREAKAAAIMSHPHVIDVYDVGREGNIHYMVMENMEASLMDVIHQRGPLSPQEAVSIISQVCGGLAHAHEQGIIHRDIKPHNIMFKNDQHKIGDFGISRLNGATSITQTGFVMGSVHYFSPEQARGRDIGYQSDVYSLGVVLFYLVTGVLPFDGEEAVAIALNHLQEPVPDPRQWNPNIPQGVCEVIYRAMEKEPHLRYTTADEMKKDLDQALNKSFIISKPSTAPPMMISAKGDNHSDVNRQVFGGQVPTVKKSGGKRMGCLFAAGALAIIALTIFVLLFSYVWYNRYSLGGLGMSKVEMPTGSQQEFRAKKYQDVKPYYDRGKTKDEPFTSGRAAKPIAPQNPKNGMGKNATFSGFTRTGSGGNYKVSVDIKAPAGQEVFYDVRVTDNEGTKLVTNRQPIKPKSKGPTRFSVSTPSPTGSGFVKIRMYRVDPVTNETFDTVEYLLEKVDQ